MEILISFSMYLTFYVNVLSMHLREDRNPELYLPATSNELLQFSRKLDRACINSVWADGFHNDVLRESSVTLADGSLQVVRLKSEYFDDHVGYTVEWNHAVPLHGMQEVIQVCSVTYTADEDDEERVFAPTDFKIISEKSDEIEGYLSAERIVHICEYPDRPAFAEGTIEYGVSLVDDTFNLIETHIGFSRGLEIQCDTDELVLENLYKYGEIALDAFRVEHEQSIITRADLIIATTMLRNRGIMNSRTIAYKGAPKHTDDRYTGMIECKFDPDDDD